MAPENAHPRVIANNDSARQALRAIEREFGVSLEEMKSASRRRHIVRARWAAFRVLRMRGWSTPKIGALFNRDHTSVLYALGEIEAKQPRSPAPGA
ncbi:helix-turn-helix domain-containing protein [Vitreimonas flagellata]|uniref:helix-turn-helix domain-containing protein n=1 Tax=Vitreimonas flagellata TaxID=2560861 RepID=UPI001074F46A|nr:helix-turn-helix domain-containing protein [Vitreimonas flagellata]